MTLPAGAQAASVAGRTLPLPKAQPQRIAIIADTGCRMKKADNAWQACNDASVWPLDTIAASVAKLSPDLVMHIGDYHYRENACPPDIAGCKDSPWGYGWDTWQADLFRPAAPLLAKAPWVVVRGNHEECARAGQGWFRFLDPRPYSAARSCDDPANDNNANYSEPYAVSLGSGSQVIVFDTAKVGRTPLKTTDAQFGIYQKQFQTVAALASKAGMTTTIFTNHHPILAFAPIAGSTPAPGNLALQSVMSSLNAQAYYPPGVHVALHGHVHDFQAINFVRASGDDRVRQRRRQSRRRAARPVPGRPDARTGRRDRAAVAQQQLRFPDHGTSRRPGDRLGVPRVFGGRQAARVVQPVRHDARLRQDGVHCAVSEGFDVTAAMRAACKRCAR